MYKCDFARGRSAGLGHHRAKRKVGRLKIRQLQEGWGGGGFFFFFCLGVVLYLVLAFYRGIFWFGFLCGLVGTFKIGLFHVGGGGGGFFFFFFL